MSLAFLAKKSFNPTNLNNVERVWIAEQQAEKEKKKLAELQKQLAEERQVMELKQLQKDAGNIKHTIDRLDWMYEVPVSEETAKDKDDYLLGKKEIGTSTEATKAADKLMSNSSEVTGSKFVAEVITTSANEMFRKMHEDPMLAMKKAAKEQRLKVLKNPVIMKKLKEAAKAKKASKKDKKKKKKKRKKEKLVHNSDDSASSDDNGIERAKHGNRGRSRDREFSSKRRSRSRDREFSSKRRSRSRDREFSSKRRSRSRDREFSSKRRSRSRDREFSSKRRSRSRDREVSSKRRSRSRDREFSSKRRSRSRDREVSSKRRSRSRDREFSSKRRSRSRDREFSSKRRSRSRDREFSSKRRSRSRDREFSSKRRSRSRDRPRVNRVASESSNSLQTKRHENVSRTRRSSISGSQNRGSNVKMTREEREQRLKDMQRDAEDNDLDRLKRIKATREKEASDPIEQQSAPLFLSKIHKQALNKISEK